MGGIDIDGEKQFYQIRTIRNNAGDGIGSIKTIYRAIAAKEGSSSMRSWLAAWRRRKNISFLPLSLNQA